VSSTNRGKTRDRADNYPTPQWVVRRFLEAVPLPNGTWLEPCAGDGAIIRAVHQVLDPTKLQWTAVELRAAPIKKLKELIIDDGVIHGDFLAPELSESNRGFYNVAITNPPFSLAQPFIERCRFMAHHTVMLLRLNFLSSQGRAAFMRESRPDVYVLPNRPSFVEDGSTDSIEYAWYHWHEGSQGLLRVLASTPASERT
jgi:hypothetical protein